MTLLLWLTVVEFKSRNISFLTMLLCFNRLVIFHLQMNSEPTHLWRERERLLGLHLAHSKAAKVNSQDLQNFLKCKTYQIPWAFPGLFLIYFPFSC